MTLHKGNYYKWMQSMQRYAVKAVLGRIAQIREVLLLTVDLRGFQGNGSKYGRLRGNLEHGCWEVEAGIKQHRSWKLERGGWNVDAGTWMPVPRSRNLEPSKQFQSKWDARAGKRSEAELGRQPPASDRSGLSGRSMLRPSPLSWWGEVYVLRISVTVNGALGFHEM